jgi:hypothetical protein
MWLLSPETYVVSSNSNANEHYGLNPSQFYFFFGSKASRDDSFSTKIQPLKTNYAKQEGIKTESMVNWTHS